MKPLHEILNWKLKDPFCRHQENGIHDPFAVRESRIEEVEDILEVMSERELRWQLEDERNEEAFDHWHNTW